MSRLIDADELQDEYKKSHDGKRLLLIDVAPTITPERDIPRKPNSTVTHAWGIEQTALLCPACGAYLMEILFNEEGKTVTYCDQCGQAINWQGWEYVQPDDSV